MSSSLWSDLPLDIVIGIKNKLQGSLRYYLPTFRLISSHWSSAISAPTSFPRYKVIFTEKDKTISFFLDSDTPSTYGGRRSFYLSLPSFIPACFLCSSNGWLIFRHHEKSGSLHLFDPVSHHKLILPRLSPKLLHIYNKLKPIIPDASSMHFLKVIVSTSADNGIAVAGIVQISSKTNPLAEDKRLVFFRHDNSGQKWKLLMEESKGIVDIVLVGDRRFYAIGQDWELYMVEEKPQLIRLRKIKLWMPKHALKFHLKNDSVSCCRMKGCGGSSLIIYGHRVTWNEEGWIVLKLDVANLCFSNKNNVDVACEAEWCPFYPTPYSENQYFTPLLGSHSKFKSRHGIKH